MRTFLASLGFLFAVLIVFCASFLATVVADIDSHTADYETLAVDVTRKLSKTWTLADIEEHYAADAREELQPVLGYPLDSLKQLGAFEAAEIIEVEPRWSRNLWAQVSSAGVFFERLSEMINRSVRVTFVARFKGGLADVVAELKREGKAMKLWRLRIDSRQPRPAAPPPRRVISHA